jgi:monoamine oxidase/DNA-binding beta-propeller fold protein YncE/ABC-type branched-subunit amino acid transport system substrate-binding protein
MHTIREPFADGLHAEAGAMRLPGQNAEVGDGPQHFITNYYVQKFGIATIPFKNTDENTFLQFFDDKPVRVKDWKRAPEQYYEKYWPGWNNKLKESGKDKDITSIEEYWKQTMAPVKAELKGAWKIGDTKKWEEWVAKWGQLSGYEYLREEGQDGLRPWPEKAIACWETSQYMPLLAMNLVEILRDELGGWWKDPMYTLKDGMDMLAKGFTTPNAKDNVDLASCISYGCQVFKVDRSEESVVVYYRTTIGKDMKIEGDAVILTVPLTIMSQIQFIPPLPARKQEGFNKVFYETSTKVLAQFKTRFWEKTDGTEGSISGGFSKTDMTIGQIHYPSPGETPKGSTRGVLVSYTWTRNAQVLGAQTPEMRLRTVVDQISRLHPNDDVHANFEVGYSHPWFGDPFAQGAFALFRPHQYNTWFNDMAAPENRCYFAGEALSWYLGWIQGALESGLRAAFQFYEDNEISSAKLVLLTVEQSLHTAGVYIPSTGERLANIGLGYYPHEIEVSPDSKTAYVTNFGLQDYDESIGYPGFTISVIDLTSLTERGLLFTFSKEDQSDNKVPMAPHGIKIRPKSNQLFVATELPKTLGAQVLVYDLENEATPPKRVLLREAISHEEIKFTEGKSLLGVNKGGHVPAKSMPGDELVHKLIFSANGEHMYLVAQAHGIILVNPDTGLEIKTWKDPGSAIHGLVFTRDQQFLVASGTDSITVLTPNLEVNRQKKGFGVGQILNAEVTPNQKYIVAPAVWASSVLILSFDTLEVIKTVVVGLDPVHVCLSPDSQFAYVGTARGSHVARICLKDLSMQHINTGFMSGVNGIALARRNYTLQPKKKLKFGASLKLTKNHSFHMNQPDTQIMLGIEFWKERVNRAGGIFINNEAYEVETHYHAYNDDKDMITKLEQLIKEEGVSYLFGPYGAESIEAATLVAASWQMPMLVCSGQDTPLLPEHKFTFDVLPSIAQSMWSAVNRWSDDKSTIVVLCSETMRANGIDFAKRSKAYNLITPNNLPPGFTSVERISIYEHNTQEFPKFVDELKVTVDTLVCFSDSNEDSIALAKACRDNGLIPKLVLFSNAPVATEDPYLFENTLSPNIWHINSESPGYDRWVTGKAYSREFKERYLFHPSYLAAAATSCGTLFETSLRQQGFQIDLRKLKTTTSFGTVDLGEDGRNAWEVTNSVQYVLFKQYIIPVVVTDEPNPFTKWEQSKPIAN